MHNLLRYRRVLKAQVGHLGSDLSHLEAQIGELIFPVRQSGEGLILLLDSLKSLLDLQHKIAL